MLLEEITMPAFVQGLSKTRTVIVPFGSVEEHGAHLPLGTDTAHVYELAKEACKVRPIFVAPPIWYGLCKSTGRHPGTVTISGATVKILTIEIVTSLYQHGLRNFVLISGHAGKTHMAALLDAGEEILGRLKEAKVAVLTVLDLVAMIADGLVETKNDSHAGEVETSLMEFLRPWQIKGTSPEEYPIFPHSILVRNKRAFWPGGIWGNPAKASREKGETILKKETELLVELVDKLESFNEEEKDEKDLY
ncbi:creatininase family protein [Dissulfurimicrobium hydrothermale]|nr:creatininase family protein [Dissulfurimicrobium hydrothermale]UKL14592.1 creatininase family protein [Dissulfurimicrobium hydrothermale]